MAELYTNLARSTLASGIGAGDLSLTVQAGDGNILFPDPGVGDFFRCLLYKEITGEIEFIRVTARSADVLTIVRTDQEVGNITPAVAYDFDAGDVVELRPSAAYFDSLTVADTEIQRNAYNYAADTGSANAYAVALTPTPAALTNGFPVYFKALNANSGSSTLSVSPFGNLPIRKHGNKELVSGDILASVIYHVVYAATGSQWILQTPSQVPPDKVQPQGIGSGLDADTVDGLGGPWLLNRDHHTGFDDLRTDVSAKLPVTNGGTQKENWTRGALVTGNVNNASITSIVINATTCDLTLATTDVDGLSFGNDIEITGTLVGSGAILTDLLGIHAIASVLSLTKIRINLTTTGAYTSGGLVEGPLIGVNSSAKGQILLAQGSGETPIYLSDQGTASVDGLLSGGAGADPVYSRVAVPSDFVVADLDFGSWGGTATVTRDHNTGFAGNEFVWGLVSFNQNPLSSYIIHGTDATGRGKVLNGAYAGVYTASGATGRIRYTVTGSNVSNFIMRVSARKNIT